MIIYLNGPSSCGKTYLAHALQKALKEPFLYVSMDRMIQMMPPSFNDWTGGVALEGFSWKRGIDASGNTVQELQIGPFAQKMVESFKEVILSLAKAGHNIIIDDVAFGEKEVALWKERLKDFDVLYVGIFASLEVLEQREQGRSDRIAGSARAQYYKCHQNVDYDLFLDTDTNSLAENVTKIKDGIVGR
jgi:chloramphenicol 3-O phosphotransferase